ncbi:hypothetical protein [Microvirga sp. CF3016]|uniref:hypothetical protein n=1 Tax=Microvirga sp. CF3016 TaxID=3110181 RepID=UPI002E7814D6|nr:hypothetical protein [Microvirga sp. CF3016]MEE1611342.1 hypothetical protein [Microvirga sp. CF3016]
MKISTPLSNALSVTIACFVFGPVYADELICRGPFARDSDYNRLVSAFGRANVTQETVYGAEGTEFQGTIVFPNDPARRLEIIWIDEKARRYPARIEMIGSSWSGPKGLRVGMPMAAVEAANGKPFSLSGFDWDYGGTVESWKEGVLSTLPGGCILSMIFRPDENVPMSILEKVGGSRVFASDSTEMRAANPRIESLKIGYPQR